MCLEWLCRGTGRFWSEHRRFDLNVAVVFEKMPHGRDHLGSRFKYLACRHAFLLDREARTNQIVISLPLANFGICNAVHFVGHREHGFGKELQLFDMNAQFAGVCDKEIALDTDEIAMIQKAERRPAVFFVKRVVAVVLYERECSLFSVDLEFINSVGQVDKVPAQRRGQTTGNADVSKLFEPSIQSILDLCRRTLAFGKFCDDRFDLTDDLDYGSKMQDVGDRVFSAADTRSKKLVRIDIADKLTQSVQMLAARLGLVVWFDDLVEFGNVHNVRRK